MFTVEKKNEGHVKVSDLIEELQEENPDSRIVYMYVTYEKSLKERIKSFFK